MPTTIEIDERISSDIPRLRPEEFAQLEENIRRDGCRTPLTVWRGSNIPVDGHNRFDICRKHEIPYQVEERDFGNLDDVLEWIETNQLGRRNLTPDQFAYFIGRKYDRLKRAQGGTGAN